MMRHRLHTHERNLKPFTFNSNNTCKTVRLPGRGKNKRKCHAQNGALVLSNQKLLRNLIASAMRHVSSIWRKTLLPSRQSLRIARVARAWRLHHRLATPPPKPNELVTWLIIQRSKTTKLTEWRGDNVKWIDPKPKTPSLDSTIKQQTNTRNKGPKKNTLQQWSSGWLDVVGNLFRLEYFLFGLRMMVRNRASCWRMVKSLHSYQTWMSWLFLGCSRFLLFLKTLSKSKCWIPWQVNS